MKTPLNTLILCALALASAACGGRTEVLRQRQARNVADGGVPSDATLVDWGHGSDGGVLDIGGAFDSAVADAAPCIEAVVAEDLTVPEPGDFFSPFRALVDETSFYVDRRNGRSRQIIKRAINGGPEEQLSIEPGSQLLGAAGGRILLNNEDTNFPVGLYRDGSHVLFNTQGRAEIREGADYQYISAQRVAWVSSVGILFTLEDFSSNGFPQRRGEVVAAPAVAGDVLTWAQRAGRDFELIVETPADTRAIALSGRPEWIAASTREISYVLNGQAWVLPVAGQQQPQPVEVGVEIECAAVVASEQGSVFLCLDEFSGEVVAFFTSGGVANPVRLAPGEPAAIALGGRYFSYVVFPDGENFCPGGAEGAVVVHDLQTSIDYQVGTVTSPCLCCDRISHTPRVQVVGNVVSWTGERADLNLEFGAVRMQTICLDDD